MTHLEPINEMFRAAVAGLPAMNHADLLALRDRVPDYDLPVFDPRVGALCSVRDVVQNWTVFSEDDRWFPHLMRSLDLCSRLGL